MNYFSGFSLQNEKELFKEYIKESDFNIVGFSYGAIKAFEFVLNSKERVDKLTLISPAFFQNRDKKFKRVQLISFKKDRDKYIDNFLNSCSKPSNFNLEKYLNIGTYEELDELLNYQWQKEKIETILNRGIKIEVFLGGFDEIVNSNETLNFFRDLAKVYFIKEVGHILK